MSKEADELWAHLQGRLFAMELMLSHLIWSWALDHGHPPTALATYFQWLEERAAADAADPANHPAAMRAMQDTIRGMAETAERRLHEQILQNTNPSSRGKA